MSAAVLSWKSSSRYGPLFCHRGNPVCRGNGAGTRGDIVKPFPFHIRRACRRSSRNSLSPRSTRGARSCQRNERIRRPKRHENAALLRAGGVHLSRVVGAHINRIPATMGPAKCLVSNSTLQTMFRPVVVPSQPWIARLSHRRRMGRMEAAGTTGETTRSPGRLPAITINAHSASLRIEGSFAAALSASRAVLAFGPMLPKPQPRKCARKENSSCRT